MKNSNYKNRGMYLENMLNDSNTFYLSQDKAIIYKKPTPIKVLEVSYPTRKTTTINKAVFSSISTLDYVGIYKGKYIEFDAKECKSHTSFPLANIKSHQISHIKNIIRHKGIVFLLIYMNDNFFLLKGDDLVDYVNNSDRKSIEFNYIEKKGFKIRDSYLPKIDYLDAVDKAYFMEEKSEIKN